MKMYSLKGIYVEYGITVPMLKKLIADKKLTRVKVGAKNFIRKDDIEAYIERNTIKATNV